MKSTPEDMSAGTVHNTNCNGKLIIIKYNGWKSVFVEFLQTGYKTTVESSKIRIGEVKDLLHPLISGVGYVGCGDYKPTFDGKMTSAYCTWRNMIIRCYCPKYQLIRPTYIGCEVCEQWHNFQTFAAWFYVNRSQGRQIDKDIKIKGNKVYSPDTCIFVSAQENMEQAHSKKYRFKSPNGVIMRIYNLRKFCTENNLSDSKMCLVHSGKRNHHKEWTKA